jgi:thymidylate synthase (FAD)
MKVTLLHHTPLNIAVDAIRTCWQSFDKSDTKQILEDLSKIAFEKASPDEFKDKWGIDPEEINPTTIGDFIGEADKSLLDRITNKFKHQSTIEHIYYNFKIEGISRALLQELARHRIASLSVKSTRYTLKELKNEDAFIFFDEYKNMLHSTPEQIKRAKKYLVFTGNNDVDMASVSALDMLRNILKSGTSNDIAKYCLPESYKTELTWSINARSLNNFLSLRSSKAALWEIRKLAQKIYEALPKEHKETLFANF